MSYLLRQSLNFDIITNYLDRFLLKLFMFRSQTSLSNIVIKTYNMRVYNNTGQNIIIISNDTTIEANNYLIYKNDN